MKRSRSVYLIYFIVLSYVSQLPILEEKRKHYKMRALKMCLIQPHKVKSPPVSWRL